MAAAILEFNVAELTGPNVAEPSGLDVRQPSASHPPPRIPFTTRIRNSDPLLAGELYEAFAPALRAYLRRHSGIDDVEPGVLSVLLAAVRTVRNLKVQSVEQFNGFLWAYAQQELFKLRARDEDQLRRPFPERPLAAKTERLSAALTKLTRPEREVFLRAFVLQEPDGEISAGLKLPVIDVRRMRLQGRRRVLQVFAAD